MTAEESTNPDTHPAPPWTAWFWYATIGLALAAGVVGFVVARPSPDPVMSGIDPSAQTLPDPGPIDTLDLDGLSAGDEPIASLEPVPAVSEPPTAATPIPPSTAPPTTAPPATAPPLVLDPPATAPSLALDPPISADPVDPPVTVAGAACTSADGWSLVYPADWYTGDGELACVAFAPYPIVVASDTELDGAVFAITLDEQFDVVVGSGLPEGAALLEENDEDIGGRRAISWLYEEGGLGPFPAGTLVYDVYLEYGDQTVLFTTWHEGGDLPWFGPVVNELASSFSAPFG